MILGFEKLFKVIYLNRYYGKLIRNEVLVFYVFIGKSKVLEM